MQEAVPPEGRAHATYRVEGIDEYRRWGSAVLSYGYESHPVTVAKSRYAVEPERIDRSHPGAVVVAEVRLSEDILLTAISVYGLSRADTRTLP